MILTKEEIKNRFKLFIYKCTHDTITDCITSLSMHKINSINIGHELARFLDNLEDYRFLSIDTLDCLQNTLNAHKTDYSPHDIDIVAIYNLGILFEPILNLNATTFLKEYSKNTILIVIWPDKISSSNELFWGNETNQVILDFSDLQNKTLNNAV